MLEITERAVGDVTVLRLSGRLVLEGRDSPLVARLDGLAQEGRIRLVLDLRDVRYIDSAGLGLLVAKFVSLRRRGGDLRFVHLSQRSEHLMGITNLSTVFPIFESDEDAIRSFQAP